MLRRQARCSAGQIELDHFRRARAHQKQQFDFGAASKQLAHHAVELGIGIGQAGQIALVDDGGGKARLGKNHDAGSGLNQVRASARTHHQEKRVLNFAVQPNDAGQPAKHLVLAALAQHRRIAAAACGFDGNGECHGAHAAAIAKLGWAGDLAASR